MFEGKLWLDVLALLGAASVGAFATAGFFFWVATRRARSLELGPRKRIEVLRCSRAPQETATRDERARRVVEMWADQASRLEAVDGRIYEYLRQMVEEVAAVYGRPWSQFRVSKAARTIARLLTDDLSGPLAVLDRFVTVSNLLDARRYYQVYKEFSLRHPGVEPTILWANRARRWAVRAYRVATLAIPNLVFYEAATSAAIHYGKKYFQGELRDLTEKVGMAAIEVYGEALVGREERSLIEASLLFDLLVRTARIAGITPERDLLLRRYLKRQVGELDKVEELYARFREELGQEDVEKIVPLVDPSPEEERLFFETLSEIVATEKEGHPDRRRMEKLRERIRELWEKEREERAQAKPPAEPAAPIGPAPFETILSDLIEDDVRGRDLRPLAELLESQDEAAVKEREAFFGNEAKFFRATDVDRFGVSREEATHLVPRLARLIAAVRLHSGRGKAEPGIVRAAFQAAAGSDADADEIYAELRRAVLTPDDPSIWKRLSRLVTGDPKRNLLPTERLLEAARRVSGAAATAGAPSPAVESLERREARRLSGADLG
ncbi:MAG: hypothetical protein HY720_10185 [Planctomycetes bacterium]|nr:hypothetical protein [Planctomycetota bacterium]